jgi:hypothetical protein
MYAAPCESAVRYVLPELVNCVEEALVTKVLDAIKENGEVPFNQRGEVVDCTATPAYVVGVQSKVAAPVIVTGAEPRMVKDEQLVEPAQEAVVVETPYTPLVPFETKSWDEVRAEVVESPV